MSVEFKNYYDILGVAPNASSAEIKKAFRKLGRKFHPDVAKDKSNAENRFKEINEANEVLSDPDKRRNMMNWEQTGTVPTGSQLSRQADSTQVRRTVPNSISTARASANLP